MEVVLVRNVEGLEIWAPLVAVMVEVQLLPFRAESSVREVPLLSGHLEVAEATKEVLWSGTGRVDTVCVLVPWCPLYLKVFGY